MTGGSVVIEAHQAYAGKRWREAHDRFAAADEGELGPDDVERYARTAALLGDDERYVELLGRAGHAWATCGELARAAECACHMAVNLMLRGEWGPAVGWLRRARERVEQVGVDCAAGAWLLGTDAIQALRSGDATRARALFEQARAVGQRCGDPNSAAMAGMGTGQALISMGRTEEGLACLDEVMVALTGSELDPVLAGTIYCGVIAACQEGYDVRRAGEWTRALTRWCDAQPDLVPFRGQCLVHRAQILQLRGSWSEAGAAIDEACRALSEPGHPAQGMAHYERGELLRLRGEFAEAEQAYTRAARFGHETQPGWALLRLAQGRIEQARAGVARALGEANAAQRPALLATAVAVALAADDRDTARSHAGELAGIAARHGSLLLDAMAGHAVGASLLADGRAAEALTELRRAWRAWQDVEAPYPAARARVLVARACQLLGDGDAARMEFDAAAAVFDELGARPDLRQVRELAAARQLPAGLTAREAQVLRQVAAGRTNRAIATELYLSEKTVARHVSNIFAKLGVSSRSAATAYAYEQGLV